MISLPPWVEVGNGVGSMLASLACVDLMLLQFGLLVRWLELSDYLFVKIQLLSASFATKYYILKLQLLHFTL